MYNREQLKTELQSNIATVTFNKTDGSVRHLKCTLQEHYLPKTEPSESKKPRAVNTSVLNVWDIENNGWRSFRVDSVTNVVVERSDE